MSVEDDTQTALTATRPAALSTLKSPSIAARGRILLLRKEAAEVLLRRGLELLKSAPSDPWSIRPNDLVLNERRSLAQKLQITIPEEERKLAQLRKRGSTFREAFQCFSEGYELDPVNPELIYQLAEALRVGCGCEVDEPRSVGLFQRAANMGHAAAQTSMGDAHAQCGFECLPRNEALAAKWYESAAELGDEEAVCMIVDYYQRGIGVKQDHAPAARILRKAAARGDETAQGNLATYAAHLGPPYADE
jgi:TPR repeat protein